MRSLVTPGAPGPGRARQDRLDRDAAGRSAEGCDPVGPGELVTDSNWALGLLEVQTEDQIHVGLGKEDKAI